MKLSADLTNKLRDKLGLPATAGAAEITEAMRLARARLALPHDATGAQVASALGVTPTLASASHSTTPARGPAHTPTGTPAAEARGAGSAGAALTFTAAEAGRIRASLELARDAGAGAVVEAVEAVVADSLEDLAANTSAAAAATGAAMDDAAPQPGPGHVVLTEDAFRELEERAIHGGKSARDAYLDSVSDRYFPESRQAWERQYDLDPQMTRHYLDQASPIVSHTPTTDPTNPAGSSAHTFAEVSASDEYKNWTF